MGNNAGVIAPRAETVSPEGPPPAEGQAPVESPLPSQGQAPADSPLPSQGQAPAESPLPSQGQAPAESPLPSQGQVPADSPLPSQGQVPAESPRPSDGQAPVESPPGSEAPPPLGSLPPSESPLPSETPSPSDGLLPSDSPLFSESLLPSESAPPSESQTLQSAQAPGGIHAPASLPPGAWIAIGAALSAAVIGTAVAVSLRRQSKASARARKLTTEQPLPAVKAAGEAPAPQPVAVGKLHQQGTRASQQDCFSVSPEDLIPTNGLLAVVADGMGGLADGDKVSQTVVSSMINDFFIVQGEPEYVLLSLLERANYQVNCLLGPEGRNRSGSTLVAGLVKDGYFHFLSVGDSRICLYRAGALYQLNREHIFRRELELRAVNRQEELQKAASHPKAAGLTSFLGMGELKYVDMPAQPVAIRGGDKFVLMSDGVYNAVTEEEMAGCLELPPESAAQALGQAIRGKNYSNQDNYTAVILGF